MFRASRAPQGPDPYLDIRIGLFVIGAILGVTGMVTGVPVIISFGILALAIGMLLRFLSRARSPAEPPPDADDETGGVLHEGTKDE